MKRKRILSAVITTATALSILMNAVSCDTPVADSSDETTPHLAVSTTVASATTGTEQADTATTFPPATVPTTFPPATVPSTYPPATVPTGTQKPTAPTASTTQTTPPTATTTQTTQQISETTTQTPVIPPNPTAGSQGLAVKAYEAGWCEVTGTGSWSGTDLVIPSHYEGNPVKQISSSAFTQNGEIRTVTLPETITAIGAGAFDGMSGLQFNRYGGALYLGTATNPYFALIRSESTDLTSCEMHENTRIVADNAFADCTALTTVMLADGLLGLGKDPFSASAPIRYAEYEGGLYLGSKRNPYRMLIRLTEDAGQTITLHPDTERIERHAFSETTLTSLTLPQGLRSIAGEAFYRTRGGYDVDLPEGTAVEGSAFKDASIGHIYVPASVSLAPYAFASSNLTAVTLADGRTEIPDGLFLTCLYLSEAYLPNSVRYIGDQAFRQCQKLLFIDLPDQLVSIGHEAFQLCENLRSLTFPDTLVSIDSWAFHGCKRLMKLYLPESIITMGEHAFASCEELTEVIIDARITVLENSSFHHCLKLAAVTLPETLEKIESYAFTYCKALKIITIPNGVREIGASAFGYCSTLTIVNLPASLRTIGAYTFADTAYGMRFTYPLSPQEFGKVNKDSSFKYGNSSITFHAPPDDGQGTLQIPNIDGNAEDNRYFERFTFVLASDGSGYYITAFDSSEFSGKNNLNIPSEYNGKPIIGIGDHAFAYLKGISHLGIPSSIRTIGDYAFYGAEVLEYLTFYDDIEQIGKSAFASTPLTYVKFPDKVGVIGDCAFEGCTSLVTIHLPKELYLLGGSAFADTALSVVAMYGAPQRAGDNVFYGTNRLACITWYGTAAEYRALASVSPHWLDCTNDNGTVFVVCDDEVVKQTQAPLTQDGFLFEELLDGTGYVIRGFDAARCSQGDTLLLPSTYQGKAVVGVRRRVFYTQVNGGVVPAYPRVTIPEGYRMIEEAAFTGRYISVSLPDSLSFIGDSAFEGNRASSVRIPASMTVIPARAFYNCTELREVILHDGITAIGMEAFRKTGLVSIALPEGVVSIGARAFYECKSLSSVVFPSTLRTVGEYAFYACDLKSVVLREGITSLGTAAFMNNASLTEITIPKTVTSLGFSVFYSQNLKQRITFSGTVAECKSFLANYFEQGTEFYCADGHFIK